MKKKLGISIEALVRRYGVERALEICSSAGFDAVDFGLELFAFGKPGVYSASEDEFCSFFEGVRKKADALGLTISQTHGRCSIYAEGDEDFNRRMLVTSTLDLKATAILGAPACVVHSLTNLLCPTMSPEAMREQSLVIYGILSQQAAQLGTKVALETFGDAGPDRLDFFGDVAELKRLYEEIEFPAKTLCMDTGHTNKAGRFGIMAPEDAIRYLGKEITLLHLNENNGWTDQHQPPFCGGTVRWGRVMDALEEIGYEGVYNFELELHSKGSQMEAYVCYLGNYLRAFLDGCGRL